MNNLKQKIKNSIRQYLNENIDTTSIKNILIKRIPFLKEYNIYDNPRDDKRLEAQRIVYNKNVKVMMGDDLLTFENYNVSSYITYYSHKVHDNTFHIFSIEHKFHTTQPEEMDKLTYRFFLIARKFLQENLSYYKEIMVPNNQEISKEQLDQVINDMNGNLFKIEEFTNDHSINLF